VPHPKSTVIRQFIIDQVEEHPADVSRLTAEHFGITRQAVRRHLTSLIEDGMLTAEGETRSRRYALVVAKHDWVLNLAEHRDEDKIWRELIEPLTWDLPQNIQHICYYGFTEMFNNCIDHSCGTVTLVRAMISPKKMSLHILDDGVGIFEKIRTAFHLNDHREAILELSKGKLTTDPGRHSGQGIFFTSRAFDEFALASNHLVFVHRSGMAEHSSDGEGWLVEKALDNNSGTFISMEVSLSSDRILREVFDRYTDLEDGDYPFSKTHVPLSLARYGNEQLVSRSQAKRVLARFDRFEEVMLDFSGIEDIGQAFADEIFRVFRRGNPGIKLQHIHANDRVTQMIRRAESTPIETPGAGDGHPPGPGETGPGGG